MKHLGRKFQLLEMFIITGKWHFDYPEPVYEHDQRQHILNHDTKSLVIIFSLSFLFSWLYLWINNICLLYFEMEIQYLRYIWIYINSWYIFAIIVMLMVLKQLLFCLSCMYNTINSQYPKVKCCLKQVMCQSRNSKTTDNSKSKFAKNYWYLWLNFMFQENLLWDSTSLRYLELKWKGKRKVSWPYSLT